MLDAVIQEVRRIKEANAAKHCHDLQAMLDDLRKREGADGRKVHTLDPRRPSGVTVFPRPEPLADGSRP
jgi:hypothetical protein